MPPCVLHSYYNSIVFLILSWIVVCISASARAADREFYHPDGARSFLSSMIKALENSQWSYSGNNVPRSGPGRPHCKWRANERISLTFGRSNSSWCDPPSSKD